MPPRRSGSCVAVAPKSHKATPNQLGHRRCQGPRRPRADRPHRRARRPDRARCPHAMPKNWPYKSFNLLHNSGEDPELSTCALPGLYQRSRRCCSLAWCWFWPAPARGPRPSANQTFRRSSTRWSSPPLGSSLVSPGFAGHHGPVDRRQRSVRHPHGRFETKRRAWRPEGTWQGWPTSTMNWRGLDERHSGKGRVLQS
jgi:hypothetical protein